MLLQALIMRRGIGQTRAVVPPRVRGRIVHIERERARVRGRVVRAFTHVKIFTSSVNTKVKQQPLQVRSE